MQHDEVRVKGTPVKSFLAFLDQDLSPEQRARVFEAQSGELVDRMRDRQILATEFVPVSVLNQLTIEAARVKGEPMESFARRAGSFAAREAVNTVMRFLVRIFTPDTLLQKASSIWRTVYDRGEMKATRESDGKARVVLNDFPSEPAGCARITGWMEGMVGLTKVKNPVVRQVKCFSKGAPACEWEITWTV
jgi:hypothetical protein